jgi:L-serine dehydratase
MVQEINKLVDISVNNFFHKSEIGYCLSNVEKRIENGQTDKIFRHKEDLEECILHDFNHVKLEKTLSTLTPFKYQPYTLYRIISNRSGNYMLTIFYNDITSICHAKVNTPDLNENISEMKACEKGFLFKSECKDKRTSIVIKSINSAKSTVINNIVETFQKHNIFPEYIELWYIKGRDKKVKSLYVVNCIIDGVIHKGEIQSLQNDFERYLHKYIKPMSVFDIVGPAMVGPSSSHTAGANKIGQIARNIIIARSRADNDRVKSVEVKLLGSFRDTGPGHYTPSAIGGGLWGLAPDHPQMIQHGDPIFLREHGIDFGSFTAKFSGYKRGLPEEELKYSNEHNNNIAEILVETEIVKYIITGFSIGGGNVEVRYMDNRLSMPLSGKEEYYYTNGRIIGTNEAKKVSNATLIPAISKVSKQTKNYYMPFNSFEELNHHLKKEKKNLIDVVFEVEKNLQGTSSEDILRMAAEYWRVMKAAVKKGIRNKELSLLKLTGKDAGRINKFAKNRSLFNNIYGRATAYAVAVNEVNARCGVIVACPTAGSCGILPGVIQAYSEIEKPDRKRILESILVSGFLGMILFNDVTTAGADYGCQAEVGVGAAMAAAALTYLENGTSQEIVQAFILAIKNSLGLICDPVAGLVEIPCVKRNGIFASVAISASLMALSGVKSFISPDEVVLTMKEVGDKLHNDFKETAGGGLAKTRDGKAVDRAFESEVKRFFGDQ